MHPCITHRSGVDLFTLNPLTVELPSSVYDTSQCSLEMSGRYMPGQEGGGVSINKSHAHESSGSFSTYNRTKAEQLTEVYFLLSSFERYLTKREL